ncbi:hypothetical protein CEUSTIGMA_g4255.t1 [Chlamydomonas eustigma]|uniref:Uncharacterized protein n=1 Tax=Chlamydomonas eustigma TaxID=1157962 RepID=A0A250X1J8_9CHLO|nr:hypothetical protein CEUSTIGMA_g4255.t1 [Chlamydomonas eustigma]|eukprot:GAX76809.1 hypothetical protein CEUSTIGMA_g4255.t1 [Chlamydomonas eustigma]
MQQSSGTYVDHCWLTDGRLVVATSEKRIFILEANQVSEEHVLGRNIVRLLAMPGNQLMVSMAKVWKLMVSMAKGNMAMYRCNKDGGPMSIETSLTVPESTGISLDNSILHMASSLDGNKVAAFPKHGPIFLVDINLALHSLSEDKSDLWEEALPSPHSAGISSLSLATKRDFLATASADDLTVRVWQYNPLRLVVTHYCHHSPLTLGMDPWGRELIICYVDCCRCYSIVEGMLMEVASLMLELPDGKGPRELSRSTLVKYNPTGHMIAVTAGTGGKDIAIFSTLFHKQIALLRGHFTSVKDMAWSEDGLYLVSCSDGEVYTWHMETFTKSQSSNVKSYPSSSVACTADFSTLIVGEGPQGLRIMQTKRAFKQTPAVSSLGVPLGVPYAYGVAEAEGGPRRGSLADYNSAIGSVEGGSSGLEDRLTSSLPMAGSKNSAGGDFRVPSRATLVAQAAKADQEAAATSMAMAATNGTNTNSRSTTPAQIMRASKALAMTQTLAMVQGLGLGERRIAVAAGASGTPLSELQASNVALPILGGDSSELSLTSMFGSIMAPNRACIALMECLSQWRAIVGAEMLGRARVCSLPPKSNSHYQEYSLHNMEITSMVSHRDGRILFTGDSSGCWKMHALMPFSAALSPSLAVAISRTPETVPTASSLAETTLMTEESSLSTAFAAATLGGPFGVVPAYGDMVNAMWKISAELGQSDRDKQATQLVSVRMVDLNGLKESVRELKDKMSKAATASEYKLYQREHDVRRELEGELNHWKSESEELQSQLRAAHKELNYAKESHYTAEQQLRAEMEEALDVERDAFMAKYAVEIERTNIAETGMERAKAKFGKKLWEMEEERTAGARAAAARAMELEANMVATKAAAEKTVQKSKQQMEMEARVDLEVNDEEISRVSKAANTAINTEKARVEVLLAKFTLQSGLYHKTIKDNEDLLERNEQLVKEKEIIASQAKGLMQELDTMKEAWQERDVRQRAMATELKDLMQQNQQAVLFTNLANSRIQDLKDELDPVKTARSLAQETVIKMEELQVKQSEKRLKATMEHENLKQRYEMLKAELKQTRIKLEGREDYFKNFTTQLFRTIHTVGHEQWSYVFGRLFEDYVAGKDLANWSKYLPDRSGIARASTTSAITGSSPHPARHVAAAAPPKISGRHIGAAMSVNPEKSAAAMSVNHDDALVAGPQRGGHGEPDMVQQSEWEAQMKELQAHVKHLEKNLAHIKEGRDRSEASQKLVIQRLVMENMTVIEESNTYKRELRMVREQLDKALADLHMVKVNPNAAPSSGYSAPNIQRTASDTSNISATANRSGLHRLAASGMELGETRELSSAELQAAAAAARKANSTSLRPATSQGLTPTSSSIHGGALSTHSTQAGSCIPTILEDQPSSLPFQKTVADSRSGSSTSTTTPTSSVVTGEMPNGGWWLGDNMFEIPANLSTVLSRGCSEANSRPYTSQEASARVSPFALPKRPGTNQGGSRLGSRPSFAPVTPSKESNLSRAKFRTLAHQTSTDAYSMPLPSAVPSPSAAPGEATGAVASWDIHAGALAAAAQAGGRAETAALKFGGRGAAAAGTGSPASLQKRPGTSPAFTSHSHDKISMAAEVDFPSSFQDTRQALDLEGVGVISTPPAGLSDFSAAGGAKNVAQTGLSPPNKSTRALPPAFLNLIQSQVKVPGSTNSIRMSTMGGGFRSFRGQL